MTNPTKGPNGVYYYVKRVPKDLVDKIGRERYSISLRTKDPREAKRLCGEMDVQKEREFRAVREGPQPLTFKEIVGLAGLAYRRLVERRTAEPGEEGIWRSWLSLQQRISEGDREALHQWYGNTADSLVMESGRLADEDSRVRLISELHKVFTLAGEHLLKTAQGDYSPDPNVSRFPPPPVPDQLTAIDHLVGELTFEAVIDSEVEKRALGKDAVPMKGATERKFRAAATAFVAHRKSPNVATITAKDVEAWKRAMLQQGEISNNTIKQRVQNLRTVVEWAREQSLGELFPNANPLALVKLPAYRSVNSADRTYTMDEAKAVLKAARNATAPELRWLPWMLAYSGARINELAQLTKGDFFQVDGRWFYNLTTKGGRSLKTQSSARRVPVHHALIGEGLVGFINTAKAGRLFPPRSQPNLSEWIRKTLKIEREDLAPNHGWRHLFEDLCMQGGVLDAARNYITGRATGNSNEGYGKSQALLPGLAREIDKVPTLL
jgi:integrase